jgi:hypothetical protein
MLPVIVRLLSATYRRFIGSSFFVTRRPRAKSRA